MTEYNAQDDGAGSYLAAIEAKRLRGDDYYPTKRFRSGKYLDGNGYVVLASPVWGDDNGRREHRVVMERKLGRPLTDEEVVHHINGDKADNRPENLEVHTRASHNRAHGNGEERVCPCGATRWYAQSVLTRMLPQSSYRCAPCSRGLSHTRTCKRCSAEFLGGKNAQFCSGCTRKKAK